MGLQGQAWPVLPNVGGFDLAQLAPFRAAQPTSQRKIILLKGYQHLYGRALFALRALVLCQQIIRERGYEVVIYSANPEVTIAAQLAAHEANIPIRVIPHSPLEEILRLHGQARVYIGNSISDAISISSLEAMCLGAFPVQSNTACCDEWFEDGRTALFTEPEDPHSIAAALQRALTDDALVDQAAQLNLEVARQRLDPQRLQAQVIDLYQQSAARPRRPNHPGP
ncbi:MAG: glycosyltransferase [Anaerolineae bacterium]|nr:glycosyltransferase [Anaerolineae bacterium]